MMADAASRFSRVRALLQDAIGREVFPCATLEVGRTDEVLFQDACGRHTYDHTAPVATIDTIFDLASMTKVLATTTIVMRLVDEGREHAPVAKEFFEDDAVGLIVIDDKDVNIFFRQIENTSAQVTVCDMDNFLIAH